MIQTASHLITGDSPMGVMLSGRDTVTHIQAQLRFSRARVRVEARRGPLLTAIVHYLREEHKDYRQLPIPAPTATASEYFTAQAGAFPHLAHTLAEMVLTSPGVLQEFMHIDCNTAFVGDTHSVTMSVQQWQSALANEFSRNNVGTTRSKIMHWSFVQPNFRPATYSQKYGAMTISTQSASVC